MYRQGDGLTGGIGAASDGGPGQVTFYVHSDNPQGILDKVAASGGQVVMPLTEVAPETTIALFADPEGHVVGMQCGPGRYVAEAGPWTPLVPRAPGVPAPLGPAPQRFECRAAASGPSRP